MKSPWTVLLFLVFLMNVSPASSQTKPFSYLDVYELSYASDPQISPDGEWIVFRRMEFDILKDAVVGQLWKINRDGNGLQKLTVGERSESSPRWSPTGDRIAFVSSTDEGSEIYMYWTDSGNYARISQLPYSPSALTWSPDGKQLSFSMNVEQAAPVLAKMPKKPKGAKWAEAPRITDRLYHEADGRGYINPGFNHLFVLSADGGTARQITSGNYHHRGNHSWTPDGKNIILSSNRNPDWEYDFRNSELYKIGVYDSTATAMTSRSGPDHDPVVSPDGRYIAYVGFEDQRQAYQVRRLQLMNSDGTGSRVLTASLDRSVRSIRWDSRGRGLYFMYDDKGNTKIGHVNLQGQVKLLASNIGGTSLGRPYAGGSYSVSRDGTLAYTLTSPYHPAEVAVYEPKSGNVSQLTSLNKALLDFRELGKVEEVWYTSSFDDRPLQGWIVYPPAYKPDEKYPFLVENHGGPISNYGDRFSTEMQLYAAAGYIVFYPNARGSTSYGEEFGNLLYRNYPGEDYLDVMDGVDFCIGKGIAHEDQLFVTGGSAGGIMTAWIIGKNNRFEAAVVAKPVMNWISKTLVADNYFYYANSRYEGQPWENFEEYWKFSPISLVGNVETPTMVMVGMDDLRTPPSEAKQLYHALKLRKVETVLVEIPGASHGIANKPSNLIAKIAHTVAWLDKYRTDKE